MGCREGESLPRPQFWERKEGKERRNGERRRKESRVSTLGVLRVSEAEPPRW